MFGRSGIILVSRMVNSFIIHNKGLGRGADDFQKEGQGAGLLPNSFHHRVNHAVAALTEKPESLAAYGSDA